MDDRTMIVAAEFDNSIDANMACGLLQSAGIRAQVQESIMGTIYGAGATWAPTKLYVPAADADKARQILHDHGDI